MASRASYWGESGMRDIDQFLKRTGSEENIQKLEPEAARGLFRCARHLADLAQRLALNAKGSQHTTAPKSYAPSRLGIPLPLPSEAGVLSREADHNAVALRRGWSAASRQAARSGNQDDGED